MPKNSWTLAWLLLCLCGSPASAASNGHYTVDPPWTTDDGLPQNSVLAMTQTRDGYLWLATLYGLVRFDGVRFTTFDESNTPQLKSSRIVKLFEDTRTNLWIGTETEGVVLVNSSGKVTTLDLGKGTRESRLIGACEDATGAVWLCTANSQLCRYRDNQVNVWDLAPRLSGSCRSLIADNSGLLWVGSDGTLIGIDPLSAVSSSPLPITQHVAITERLDYLLASRQGGHWRFADGSIQRWTTNGLERDLGPYPWTSKVIIAAACEDQEGNLFVGTYGEPGEGLYWFDLNGKATRLEGFGKESPRSPKVEPSIMSLLVDREGSLWVGTDGDGLNRVRRQVFNVLPGSQTSMVQSVCEDGQGGLWVGYNSDRVEHWSNGQSRQYTIRRPPITPLAVRSVFVDRSQKVWVGTENGGLFELQDDTFLPVPGFDGLALPGPGLFQDPAAKPAVAPFQSALYQDRRGHLWVGTQDGLAHWDGRDWRTLSTLDGLSPGSVRAIADDKEGNLWVGTDGAGLNCLRGSHVTACYNKTNGLPGDNVSCLFVDDEGILWVGTASGLARFEHGKWTTFTTREGLAGNSIRYLMEDGKGCLWIGSNAGLMRVAKQALKNNAKGSTLPIRVYGKPDGLPTRECTQGSQPSCCRTREGTLWFPTIKGLAGVDPTRIRANTVPPPVLIESVQIDDQAWTNTLRSPPLRTVTVPAGKESLEIRFTSLNLAAPEKGLFRYRLADHERAWTERPGNLRSVRYPKLPHGHYRFQVTACNEDGVWNEVGTSLAITVLPPFWQTWWFLSLTAACLLWLIVGSVHYVSTQKLQRQLATLRQHEALERERARIARDLHDQLGANLTQVALLGEMAEADKDLPNEVETHARQISQTARETTHALDEIVWTVNPSNDTLDGLINYVCKYAQDYLAMAGLRYRLEVPSQLPNMPISPELRHNVFLAAKEAVNNVVKHAQASSAWLRLQLNSDHFVLEIADNGRGLAAADAQKGRNGLRNMRKRMEDIGGSFSTAPGPDGGTIVRLTSPLREAPPKTPL